MMLPDISRFRIRNQQISRTKFATPGDIVAWLGAIQAQDYSGAKWSIGLRLRKATNASIEKAIADQTVIRTWLMRGTLHFAAGADIRWMLALLSQRVIDGSSGRHRQLELDAGTFARSRRLFGKALRGGKRLTRNEMFAVLEKAGISTLGQRGYHILGRTALEGLICFGPRLGKQQTFVLLDEWGPKPKSMHRDQALAEMAKRYFTSRGPATLQDFAWWSGLRIVDARAGLEAVASQLIPEKAGGKTFWMPRNPPAPKDRSPKVYLLPGFDEYLLGYTERTAVLDAGHSRNLCPGGNGVFRPTIVMNGRIVGTWSRTFNGNRVAVDIQPFRALTEAEERAVAIPASLYGKFLKMPVIWNGETR
jgi:hypothetical protein